MQELGVEKRGEGLLVEKDEGLVVLQQGHVIAQDADADLGDLLGGAGREGESGVVEVDRENLLEALRLDGCDLG